MVSTGEPRTPDIPEIGCHGLAAMHPDIVAVAARLFADGHYAQAIFEAFKMIEVRVRSITGLEASGSRLMAQTFGSRPPLIQVSAEVGRSGRNEQEGFKFLFMGAMQGIRNPKGHEFIVQSEPERALEYLAFASLLVRRIDDALENEALGERARHERIR